MQSEDGQWSSSSDDGERSREFEWSSDEVEQIEDPPNMVDRAVSIELLLDLLGDHDLRNKTTRQVVEEFVLPQTSDYGCSLAGLMKRSFPEMVGKGTHYVIHPWDGSFERLVQCLVSVDAAYSASLASNGLSIGGGIGGECKAKFWLDIFAIDQHLHFEGYTDKDRLWLHRDELLQNVRTCIETIPCTCIFMDPAHAPLIINRSWCLYECMQALFYSRELVLTYCPEEPGTRRMLPAILDFKKAVEAFTPDFETSETFNPQDKEWLVTAVTAAHPSGMKWLNEQVSQLMLHWLAQEVLNEIYQYEELPPMASLHDLALLLDSLSLVDQANIQFRLALDTARDQLGQHHSKTISISHDYACFQAKTLFQLVEAEELLMETLRQREHIFGRYHDITNETVIALARLLQALKRTEEAEALYRRALEHSLVEHGFQDRKTLVVANLLALLLQDKGELFEAYVLLSRTLTVGVNVLGSKHFDVIVWRNNLAVLLQETSDLKRAESLFRKALTESEQALGPDHPQTFNIVYNLAQCLWEQGKLHPAEMLFKRELAGCQAMYGSTHRDTMRSVRNMVEFLTSQNRLKDAAEYLEILQQNADADEDDDDDDGGVEEDDDDDDDDDDCDDNDDDDNAKNVEQNEQ